MFSRRIRRFNRNIPIFPYINSYIGNRKNVTRNPAASAYNAYGMTYIRIFHIQIELFNYGSVFHESIQASKIIFIAVHKTIPAVRNTRDNPAYLSVILEMYL
ncbi:hypothetical protein HMPREF1604_01693 [Escherichia coli 908519]|uniref:TrbF n=1 Tax=Escherichia coli O1:K1 / APEC TaxID=405955 RepID=A0A0H2XJK8_ECOK1|nr:TrbF [Escherichia coli APEC O1]ESD43069.1 hypothetical protein HMPREF1604_01693 [Escherichia coli 908519]